MKLSYLQQRCTRPRLLFTHCLPLRAGQQLAYFAADQQLHHLFEPAFGDYAEQLKQQRGGLAGWLGACTMLEAVQPGGLTPSPSPACRGAGERSRHAMQPGAGGGGSSSRRGRPAGAAAAGSAAAAKSGGSRGAGLRLVSLVLGGGGRGAMPSGGGAGALFCWQFQHWPGPRRHNHCVGGCFLHRWAECCLKLWPRRPAARCAPRRCLHRLATAGVQLVQDVARLGTAEVLASTGPLPVLAQQDLSQLLEPAVADAGACTGFGGQHRLPCSAPLLWEGGSQPCVPLHLCAAALGTLRTHPPRLQWWASWHPH